VIVVTYGSEQLREDCLRAEAAEQAFGPGYAQSVLSLIADIEALETGSELLDFYGTTATILPDDSLTISFGAHYAATFVTVGDRVRRDDQGRIAWGSVQRLKLVTIARC
jgi:hypothetical protein